jgi:hypothetical protein
LNAELADFFKAPEGADRGRLHEPAKKDAGLSDGYCARCDRTVMPTGVIYEADHPEASPDGVGVVSEWECPRCGRREGRWTGSVLTGGASEPFEGVEDDDKIAECQRRFPTGSQPR